MIDFTTLKDLYLANSEVEELFINGSKVWEKGGSSSPVGLTFTAEEANSTVAMATAGSSAPSVSLEYTTDNGTTWQDFIVGTTTVTLANIGDQMAVRAKTTNSGMGTDVAQYNKFVMTGKIAASGSVMYLLKKDGEQNTLSAIYSFGSLFRDCSSLTTAPELPATTLAQGCYRYMFSGCTSLTQAPDLSATTLAKFCYGNMFYGCTSLTTAPELPATTLTDNCYNQMFSGCTSLTQAPELPATTLAPYGYQQMFQNCSALTTAPDLPATTLAKFCYDNMFYGCTSLTSAPYLPATTLASRCYYCMFRLCTNLNEIKIAYTGNFSGDGVPSNALTNWVQGVAATGTFYYNGSDTTRGSGAIPTGWTIQSF